MKLAQLLPGIAMDEVGVEEIDGTNCGPRVNTYKAATRLPPYESWPWCAAFVDWCVREAMKRGESLGRHYSFTRPTTAGAWDLENWSRQQDESTQTKRQPDADILPGDIIIFRFSHCGIAIGKPSSLGLFETVEGNTDSQGSREGGGVFRKLRRLDQVRTRIRFTV